MPPPQALEASFQSWQASCSQRGLSVVCRLWLAAIACQRNIRPTNRLANKLASQLSRTLLTVTSCDTQLQQHRQRQARRVIVVKSNWLDTAIIISICRFEASRPDPTNKASCCQPVGSSWLPTGMELPHRLLLLLFRLSTNEWHQGKTVNRKRISRIASRPASL